MYPDGYYRVTERPKQTPRQDTDTEVDLTKVGRWSPFVWVSLSPRIIWTGASYALWCCSRAPLGLLLAVKCAGRACRDTCRTTCRTAYRSQMACRTACMSVGRKVFGIARRSKQMLVGVPIRITAVFKTRTGQRIWCMTDQFSLVVVWSFCRQEDIRPCLVRN